MSSGGNFEEWRVGVRLLGETEEFRQLSKSKLVETFHQKLKKLLNCETAETAKGLAIFLYSNYYSFAFYYSKSYDL